HHRARTQLGLTLVELMITMVISLAVLAAISYAYLGTRGAYRTNEGIARVQESGRFALDSIARDLRRTSFLGCGSPSPATGGVPPAGTAPNNATAIDYTNGVAAIGGFSYANGWDSTQFHLAPLTGPPAPATWVPNTDVLVIRIASSAPAPVEQLDPAG